MAKETIVNFENLFFLSKFYLFNPQKMEEFEEFQKYLGVINYFIDNKTITKEDVFPSIDKHTDNNIKILLRKIYNNSNFTLNEKEKIIKFINTKFYKIIFDDYADSIRKSRFKDVFIEINIPLLERIIEYMWFIFGEPNFNLLFRVLKKIGLRNKKIAWNVFKSIKTNEKYAKSIDEKTTYELMDNFLINNWVEYGKVLISESRMFDKNI